MSDKILYPASYLVKDLLPADALMGLDEALDFLAVDIEFTKLEWTNTGLSTRYRFYILQELSFALPFLSDITIHIGEPDSYPYFDLSFISSPIPRFSIEQIKISLRASQRLMQAYEKEGEVWKTKADIEGYQLIWETGIAVDIHGKFDFKVPSLGNVPPFMISSTGFIVDFSESATSDRASDILWINDMPPAELLEKIPFGFRGMFIARAGIHYYKEGSGTRLPRIGISDASIGSGGFSGNALIGDEREDPVISEERLAEEDFDPSELSGDHLVGFELGGMQIILWHLRVSFMQSIPNGFVLTGLTYIPFAEKWMKFRASAGGPDGDFMLELGGTSDSPLISLEHEYFEIKADSIAYKLDDGIHYAIIDGSITPKIEGFDWPEMAMEGLSISSEGDINIPGGWIRAPETITLNFGAFKIGINEIGFGNEGEEPELPRQWLGFSGELNLVEGLDLKASVEGLKFSWLKEPAPAGTPGIEAGSKDVQVSLRGIAVEFEIPNTLSFSGSVSYEELTAENNGGTGLTGKLFRGNIDLNLMSVRLQIEAELIIGKMKDADGNEFTTFFIVMGVQLPAGIPLGATGTCLYGLKGLGAYNSAPTKTEEQDWYEWYKADPEREITSMEKWMPKYDNYAFGAGVTLGTMYDDGFTLNMSVMLAILLPGPVIILEGKANLLKQRAEGQQDAKGPEGAFYLLAVLDGRAGTFMLNVDVKYSLEDVITIGASLEAFFDFNNSSNWYVYLGRKTPETKRIRAEILSLFSANAYFMIDNTSLQTGAGVGFDFRKKYGPVSIVLIARIGFDATIFWKPMQLEGSLELEASLGIKVFGIGLELYLYMLLEGRVPKPYWIHGVAEVGIKLFWPIPDISLRVELEWSQEAPTPAAWPLLKECSFTHHKGSGTTWKIEIGDSEVPDWLNFPIVPVDARPVLTFARPINNLGHYNDELGLIPIFKTTYDQVGDQKFVYKLDKDSFALEKYEGTNWEVIRHGINTDDDETEFVIERDSIINIQDDLDPNEPQLQLWKYSARDGVNDYGREDYQQNHPACNPISFPKWMHVNWLGVADNTNYRTSFIYAGLSFVTGSGIKPKVASEYLSISSVTINFPEPLFEIRIEFNKSKGVKGRIAMDGISIGEMITSSNVLIYRNPSPFNSIRLERGNQNNIRTNNITIKSIYYMTKSSVTSQMNSTSNPSPSAARQNINGKLFLEPAQFYRIKLNTSVDKNDTEIPHEEAENYIYFRTDEGPGVSKVSEDPFAIERSGETLPEGILTHKEKPVNVLATYIERTLPIDGALNHYLNYDVGMQFNESYVEKLFKNPIQMRFRDRNGKLLDESSGGFILGFLPLFHNGLLSWLSDKQDGGCGDDSTSVTPAPYLNFSPAFPFKANSLYSAEMIVDTNLGEQNLHRFQFTTSRYNSFTAHILGDYPENVIDVISLPKVAALPSGLNLSLLSLAMRKYFVEVSKFYREKTDLLKKKEYFDAVKKIRDATDEESIKNFNELDEILSATLNAINMQNRPAPTKFEIIKIPLLNSSRSLMLIESPEPIDYYRIKAKMKKVAGLSKTLSFVWNEDKTRAFLVRGGSPTFASADYQINFSFSGVEDPISGIVLRNGDIVEERVSFDLIV